MPHAACSGLDFLGAPNFPSRVAGEWAFRASVLGCEGALSGHAGAPAIPSCFGGIEVACVPFLAVWATRVVGIGEDVGFQLCIVRGMGKLGYRITQLSEHLTSTCQQLRIGRLES